MSLNLFLFIGLCGLDSAMLYIALYIAQINEKVRLYCSDKKETIGRIQTGLVIVLVFYTRYVVVLECPGVFLNKRNVY